jgi:hypothetical protein
MSEPDIIRSDRPHEVTIPEGSNKALAKTAAQQEPSVRKVQAARQLRQRRRGRQHPRA